MSKKDKKAEQTAPEQQEHMEETQAQAETQAGQPESEAKTEAQSESADPLLTELESLKDQVAQQEDKYLRLAAEYDNYRRRTAKEKDSIWNDAKADAAVAFLPVYDNLERALKPVSYTHLMTPWPWSRGNTSSPATCPASFLPACSTPYPCWTDPRCCAPPPLWSPGAMWT